MSSTTARIDATASEPSAVGPMRVVATAGHVDHGKSTLVRALTGMEPDRLDDERERGLTIDLGFAWTTLVGPAGPTTMAVVDVPGHHRFVANMLAGAGPAPAALFVVAADDGWMAQSHEHLAILDVLDVPGVAVAITKADRVDPSRVEAVVAQTRRTIRGTSLADAPVVVTDAVTGRGLEDLTGTLAARLAGLPEPADHDRAHLWVDRAFSLRGVGTVVTGTLADGHLGVGDDLVVLPAGRDVRARGLQVLGRDVARARPGSRVAVNLAGPGAGAVARGDLVAVRSPARVVADEVDAVVRVLPTAGHPLGRRGAWQAHVGTMHVAVEVVPVLDDLGPGERGHARLRFGAPVSLRHGSRLVLRDAGRAATVAGARVLDPHPGRAPRGTTRRLEHADALDRLEGSVSPAEVLVALLGARGGWAPLDDLVAAVGHRLPTSGLDRAVVVDDHLVDVDRVRAWAAGAERAVVAAGVDGLDLAAADEAATRAGAPPALARSVVSRAIADGRLVRMQAMVVAPRHAPAWQRRREERRAALVEAVTVAGLRPPDPTAVAAELGLGAADLRGVVDDGRLVAVGPLLVAPAALDRARRMLVDRFPADTPFLARDAGDAWDTTRKYTIPLLEHLADTGHLRFDGQHHRVVPPPSDAAR